MTFKKTLSVLSGFGTIVFMSTVLAKVQGSVFPSSLELFTHQVYPFPDVIQLLVKLLCVFLSTLTGGIITTRTGGKIRQHYFVAGITMCVIGWLWLNAVHPVWFWLFLISGILPFVLLGNYFATRLPIHRTHKRF